MSDTIRVDILNEEQFAFDFDVEKLLSDALARAADEMEIRDVEVSLSLVTDETIHELNRAYRDKDAPTDVLSFAQRDESFVIQDPEETEMLGDIVISVPTAIRQAADYGHSLQREIAFLAVHGFLHLLGYDHETEAEEKEMFAIQERVLESIGLVR